MNPSNTPRLDRLSALLEGLAPAMSPTVLGPHAYLDASQPPPREPGLSIYLSMNEPLHLEWAGQHLSAPAPAIVIVRWGTPLHVVQLTEPVPDRLVQIQCHLKGPVAPLFLGEFEKPCLLSPSTDEPALRWAMNLIDAEIGAPRCGQAALLQRAADILFVGLLRHLVSNPGTRPAGLFLALSEPRIAKAVVAMHQSPGGDWTLERLAAQAGMSRTSFANIFRERMNKTPGKYLSTLRLALAERAVGAGKGLKEAARSVGYRSASALSRALLQARASSAKEPAASEGLDVLTAGALE